MERERVNDAISLGLMALLCGVYVLDAAQRRDSEAVNRQAVKPSPERADRAGSEGTKAKREFGQW
jgi:hypothetical protein